jgi:hypothetical protein
MENKIYVFEDWLKNKFWSEMTYSGLYVVNDSENYLELVSMGKMTYETLNEIQDAQNEAYHYILQRTLETNIKSLQGIQKRSLDFEKYVELLIESIELDLEKNKEIHFQIISNRDHRGIKYGAKFLIPSEYEKFKKKIYTDAYFKHYAPYSIVVEGKIIHFPKSREREYLRIEAQCLWLNYLKKIKQGAKIDFNSNLSRDEINKAKGLTIDQIALNLYYEGETVTIENADEIIKKYGLTSGKKLYQQASFYSKRANRLAIRETKKKQENKIKLFEFVIDLLPPDKKQQAKDELRILENQYNAEYL